MTDKKKDDFGNPILPISDLINEGYLQEVNRCFFHPLGLALAVTCDEEHSDHGSMYVMDYRHDPEGMFFGDLTDSDSIRKANNVLSLRLQKAKEREESVGNVIQPVGDKRT